MKIISICLPVDVYNILHMLMDAKHQTVTSRFIAELILKEGENLVKKGPKKNLKIPEHDNPLMAEMLLKLNIFGDVLGWLMTRFIVSESNISEGDWLKAKKIAKNFLEDFESRYRE